MSGEVREQRLFDPTLWDRLNISVISMMAISADQSVKCHVVGCKHTAHPTQHYPSTDTQGAQQVLTHFGDSSSWLPRWKRSRRSQTSTELRLPHQGRRMSSISRRFTHLLNALPPALSTCQTSLAIANSSELPSTDHLLDLVRNEVLRLSLSLWSTSVALTASSEPPLPLPCPVRKGAHCLCD